jgi:hypothetical protein
VIDLMEALRQSLKSTGGLPVRKVPPDVRRPKILKGKRNQSPILE